MNDIKIPCKNHLLLFLCIFFSVSAFSQTNYTIIPRLNTTGLANEELIRNIFTGNLAAVNFDRDDPWFSIILDVYISAYWEHCSASLPADKVQLSYQECANGTVTKNGYGVIIRTDCYEWRTVYINEYASPAMYKAKTTVDALQVSDVFRTALKILEQDNPLATGEQWVQNGLIFKQDMNSFFGMNDCNSAGMKRFEQNLYAFAMNTLPTILEGSQMHRKDSTVLLKNQNFEKLVDDLIYDQSANWVMNTYVQHTVTYLKIVSKDGQGRPSTITADYQFKSGNKEYAGSVTLTFIEGLPNCLYFFDFPATCRTASRKIVLNYANGAYVSK